MTDDDVIRTHLGWMALAMGQAPAQPSAPKPVPRSPAEAIYPHLLNANQKGNSR